MEKQIQQLTERNENTKLFTYMIIHDLKHPTEALVDSLKQIHQELNCSRVELLEIKQHNELIEQSLRERMERED